MIETTLAEVDAAYVRALAAINAEPAAGDAAKAAHALAAHLRKLADASAQLRTRLAGRIKEDEGLSLAKLADRIGMSKARAQQIIDSIAAQKLKEGGSDDVQ